MKLSDIKTIILPDKNDEEFRKIELSSLYEHEFKKHVQFKLNENTSIITTKDAYTNRLFEWVRGVNDKQEVLRITQQSSEPLVLMYELKEDETLLSHSLKIEVADNIKASVIELFKTQAQNSAFLINREFNLEKNSQLVYAKIQEIQTSNNMVYNITLEQDNSSYCQINAFEYGDGYTLNNYINELNEPEANYNLNALVKLHNSSTVANLIRTIHNNESCLSNINVKHSLNDASTAIFKAKSIVKEKALYTKAFQSSNTLLQSDDATIFAQPHLEIATDELEASHGATTGALNKEQLLYLQSRGIKQEHASRILLDAFEKTIYENINNQKVKEYVLQHQGVYHV
ncbi:SufD family Fe-S cluster assembly protein [Candidatus Marinarcus aquaticus]|uniref:Fe-S assembly protein n=1 Tax=Candidatus Marinarcus aquaticus TaxID=2044504 RepID=A0A4V1LNQ9_9BACT|nr:SufD family Fe-S cluster assembly protein [Candidatus Marinarcus aquaticus]RXJ55277.1 Fe-S assembly protein [Candidatus Marinarcus aquaticus]